MASVRTVQKLPHDPASSKIDLLLARDKLLSDVGLIE